MILTGGKKFMYACEGWRLPHASMFHWNPPGFCKKNKGGYFFSNRGILVICYFSQGKWKHECTFNFRQEGVNENIYFPLEVNVETPTGDKLNCRSYQLCSTASASGTEHLLKERLPSEIYVTVILKGAEESGLPTSYIKMLKDIPHNGSKGGDDVPMKFPLNWL